MSATGPAGRDGPRKPRGAARRRGGPRFGGTGFTENPAQSRSEVPCVDMGAWRRTVKHPSDFEPSKSLDSQLMLMPIERIL